MQKVGIPARAFITAAQSLTANTPTKILLDTIDSDPGGVADTAHFFGGSSAKLVSNGNLYVCQNAGFYLVSGQVRVAPTGSGQVVRAYVYQNGAANSIGSQPHSSAASTDIAATVCDIVRCAAGDTLALWAYSAQALALAGTAGQNNYMSVVQIG